MWNNTKAKEILGIQYPILQGPFGGGISSAKLVAAVSNAGGLGGYGAYQLQPEEIVQVAAEIRSLTDRPFNFNLWVSDADDRAALPVSNDEFDDLKNRFRPFFEELKLPLPAEPPAPRLRKFEKQVEAILQVKPDVFSFIFGIPDESILQECRKQGILTSGSATTVDEALALEAAGVDLIVATGFEAGGHRPSFLQSAEDSLTGTFVLVQQIAQVVNTPIVAAGGIANAQGIKAAMTLGASAVQIGTAFLVCTETNINATHRQAILSPNSKYSTLTKAFTGRLARGTRSRISASTQGGSFLPMPLQGPFLSGLRAAAAAQGKMDMLTFWGGQIAPLVKEQSAAELMEELVAGMG